MSYAGTYWRQADGQWYSLAGRSSRYAKSVGGILWQNTPMGMAEANTSKLKAEYDKAFNEAKQANEQRYNQILGGYDTLYNNTMTGLEGMGDAARKDVNTGYNRAFSQSMQGLVNSGMANSTILPSVSLNNAGQRTNALNSLNEMLRREKLGYMNNISNNKLNFMERREDTYPDMNLYTSLMNNYGNYMGNVAGAPNYSYFNYGR
jgi:hypothetical protein